jgi:FkbM family methyltransferase
MEKHKGYYFPDNDNEMRKVIFKEWEKKYRTAFSLLKDNKTAVQAGGNVGVFPINLAKRFDKVVTFEPMSSTWECLEANLADHKVDNVVAYNNALASKEVTAKVKARQPNNSGATSLEYGNGVIQTMKLDSIELESLDLLWLDVEGFEVEALEGSREHVTKFSPIIVLENNGLIPGFGGDLDGSPKLLEWMEQELGYIRVVRVMRDDFYVHAKKH